MAAVTCLFCNEAPNYSCPQCHIKYCSVKCYQHPKHIECSENFYKKQVTDELKHMKVSEKDKDKIMQSLINNSDFQSNEDSNDVVDRLKDINLDDSDNLWEKLTKNEKEMFQRRIQTGNLDFVKIWEPWWNENVDTCSRTKQPRIIENIPPIQDVLQNKPPHSSLKNNTLELILVYVTLERMFNGDLYDSSYEVIELMYLLSEVLNKNQVFIDTSVCIYSFVDKIKSDKEIEIDPLIGVNDLLCILNSKDLILKTVSSFFRYLKRCRKHYKQKDKELSKRLYLAEKKIYFLLSYCDSHGTSIMELKDVIREIQSQLIYDMEILQEEKNIMENNMTNNFKKNKLIEEL